MRALIFSLPLALASASWASAPLPSYDFALKPERAPIRPPQPFQPPEQRQPLKVPPKVELGDLDPPWENAIRAYRANGSIGSPAQPDNIGIGATLPLSPQTPYIPKAGMPASPLAPNWMRDRQTGQQQAIPMHMLPALPPHRHP